jgi:peptidoglycan/LPS O-acetylase OafA/YrhL
VNPHASYLGTTHFRSLDGLRFVSIVPVIWHHSTSRPLAGVLGKGPLGVDLFFAISGFLITTLLLRERTSAGFVSVGRFYARRALRIFPLYYAVLGLYVVRALVFLPGGALRSHFFRSLPYHATFTSNWFVDFDVPHPVIFAFAWSLAAEEQFYLIWPWVVGAGRSRLVVPAIVALGLLVLDQGVEWGFWTQALPMAGLGRRMVRGIASPICMGSLLACGLHHARSFRVLHSVLGARLASPFTCAALVWLVVADGVPLIAVELVLALLVGTCCIRPDHGLSRFTDAAPIRWIGRVSYGMYMLHVAAVTSVRSILPATWNTDPVVFAFSFAATLALAAASSAWFEKRFAAARARLRSPVPRPDRPLDQCGLNAPVRSDLVEFSASDSSIPSATP